MLFALDAIPLTEPLAGVGHYTAELSRALARVAPADSFELIYPSSYPPIPVEVSGAPSSFPSNLSFVRVAAGALGRRWWSIGLPRYVRRSGIALFHGTNFEVPLLGTTPRVLTIHDLSQLVRPETHERRRVVRARIRLPLMARRADAVITPTEAVRGEVMERLGLSATRVFAVPEAAREKFRPLAYAETEGVRGRFGIGREFLLAVGTIEPRKNLAALLTAFENVLRERPRTQLQLVIAGREGWMSEEWRARLAASPARPRIVLTGYVSDDDLCALYSSCSLFVYPSVYEGFGLPPLEAMQCGAPVVASRASAVAEVTGGAALPASCDDGEELTRAVVTLLDDDSGRKKLSARGLLRAAEFSWERTARLTLEVYAEALRMSKRNEEKR